MQLSTTNAPLLGLATLTALGLVLASPAQAQSASTPIGFDNYNFSSTQGLFTDTFFVPLTTPLPAGSTVTVTLTGTLKSTTGDVVSITPSGQTSVADAFINLADSGIGTGTAQTSGPSTTTFTYGPSGGFSTSQTYADPITSIGANIRFMLSGNTIEYLSGTVTADAPVATPEPSTLAPFALAGLSLGGLLLRARKRSQSA